MRDVLRGLAATESLLQLYASNKNTATYFCRGTDDVVLEWYHYILNYGLRFNVRFRCRILGGFVPYNVVPDK